MRSQNEIAPSHARGPSKALFYVYFARKEDVLHEVEVFTMRDAHLAAQEVVAGPYELPDLVAVVVGTLERRARQFPAELIFEAVLETYRLERRALADGATDADIAFLFLEPFTQAQRDGKIPPDVDVVRAARIAQVMVADGIRGWAARGDLSRSPAAQLADEISTLVRATPGGPPRPGRP